MISYTDDAFSEALFPVPISVGSTVTAGFSTDVEASENGFEYRSSNWSQARHSYDVSTGISGHDEMALVKAWFMRASGRLRVFRFRDPQDYSSAEDGASDPHFGDQLIGVGDGQTKAFGLSKAYHGFIREIFKPVDGTVSVGVGGVEVVSGWSADLKTGLITFDVAPADGVEITAGFIFDVPVRFDADEFTATWSDTMLLTGNIPLTEVRLRR